MNAVREKWGAVIRRVVSDIIILGTGGIVLLLFRFVGDPYKRGFFCDDESLKHPFKDSTVTSAMLYGIGFVLGSVVIAVVEAMWIYGVEKTDPQQRLDINKYGKNWILIRNIYLSLIPFIFGAITEHVVTDIGKYSIGRLRPHFFDVCKVDFSKVNCSAGYIEEFECTGEDSNRIREVRLSFPSGHASFSSYVAVYLMIFLQKRLTFLFKSMIRPMLQLLIFVMAYYTCLSRVSDYKHHPTDVLAGAVVGIISAVTVAVGASDLFNMTETRQTHIEMFKNINRSGRTSGDQLRDLESTDEISVKM